MSMPIHVDDWWRALSGYHAAVVLPRRNALASRALHARSGVPAATTADAVNNRTASTSSHPTSHSVPTSSVQPRPTMHAPRGPPVALITGAAVGGVIVVVVILALVYFLRVRRRVKRMKRCTNILGPELAPTPMSPSRVSQHTIEIGSRAHRDGVQFEIVSPLTPTFNLTKNSQHPLGAPLLSSPTKTRQPLSPLRTSTVLVDPPSARRTSILTPNPRSPIRVPPDIMPRPYPLRTSTITVDPSSARRTSILSSTPQSPVPSSPETMLQPTQEVSLSLRPSTVIIGPPPALRTFTRSPGPQSLIRSSPETIPRPTREVPLSLRPSMLMLSPPPALRTPIMFSDDPRSPSPDEAQWPNPWQYPRYDNKEHSASSDSESSHTLS